MVVTCTGLEKLLEGGEADWPGLVDESGHGFSKNQYEMSSGCEKSGLVRLEQEPMEPRWSWPGHGGFCIVCH